MKSEQLMNPLLYEDKQGYFEQADFFHYWNLKRETEYHVSYTNRLAPDTGYLAEFNDLYPGLQSGLSSLLHSKVPGIALIGGAGTGKTQVLASLAGYWIQNNTYEPGEILVITFTDSEIPELSDSILKTTKERGTGIEVIGIEGFCLKLLSLVFGSTPRIFDKTDRSYFISLIFPFLSAEQKKNLCSFISSPDREKYKETEEDLTHLRDTYFHSLENIGACDREVLALQTAHLLTGNPGILLSMQRRYKSILIDDLQYMNKEHYSLISQVILHTIFLETEEQENQKIIVGIDPLLGIHKIKSTHIYQTFLSRFIQQHYLLHTSWRVPGRIIRSISRLYKSNKTKKKKVPKAYKPAGGYILLYQAKNPDDEGTFIVNTIRSYIQKQPHDQADGYAWKDFGIFSRNTTTLGNIIKILKEQRIPYSIYDTEEAAEQPPFHMVYSFFHFLLSEKDITAFVDILLHLIPGFSMADIQSIFLAGNRKNESVTQLIQRLYTEQMLSNTQYKGIITFQKHCKEIKKEISHSGILPGLKRLIAEYPGLEQSFRKYFAAHPREKQDFINHARECHTDVLQFLTGRIYSRTQGIHGQDRNHIHVAAFHYVKKLTPAVIFIPGMEEESCPSYTILPDMETETALFYSALSRAKERVYLSFTKERCGEIKQMSSFIKEIGPHIKEIIPTIPVVDFEQGTLF